MLSVKLPFLINCEDAAFALSRFFIDKGYSTDIKRVDNTFSTLINKREMVHNLIGNPVIIAATFFPLENSIGIQVKEVTFDINVESVVKETLLYALLLPGLFKRIEAVRMEKYVMRKALIVAKQLNSDGEKK